MKSTKFWITLIGRVLVLAVAAAAVLRFLPTNTVSIYQNGALIETLNLSEVAEPYTLTLENESGTNTIAVERGRICISASDCPDGSCVRQGWLTGGITPIVCLPHRIVIKPNGSDAKQPPTEDIVDAVVG